MGVIMSDMNINIRKEDLEKLVLMFKSAKNPEMLKLASQVEAWATSKLEDLNKASVQETTELHCGEGSASL